MFYMSYYMMMKTIFYDFMYNNLIAESEDTRGKEESIFEKKGTIQYLHKFPLMGISFFLFCIHKNLLPEQHTF